MKLFFYFSLLLLLFYEFLKIYYIMPMPGSQVQNSIELAYFLHTYRWIFRAILLIAIIVTFRKAFDIRWKWASALVLMIVVAAIYFLNFKMSADKMFLQPGEVVLKSQAENKIPKDRLVISVAGNDVAKAYPISFLSYHHQVQDSIDGKQIIVTYCNVCRSGRVFEPVVKGKTEKFRLVGMDHFNAMFEDESTHSWWRQATGEAVAGELKGEQLKEVASQQTTVEKFFQLYPGGYIMQSDPASIMNYDSLAYFEQGKSKGSLTRTDTSSWKDKSWVIGVLDGNNAKAYDWITLKKQKIIHDTIGHTSIIVALSSDGQSFVVFELPADKILIVQNDTLISDNALYDFSGKDLNDPSNKLRRIQAYQEFWHSWKNFHPGTTRYE